MPNKSKSKKQKPTKKKRKAPKTKKAKAHGDKRKAVVRLLKAGKLSAAQIAEKVGCATSYIYMLKSSSGSGKARAVKRGRVGVTSVSRLQAELKRAKKRVAQLTKQRGRVARQLADIDQELAALKQK